MGTTELLAPYRVRSPRDARRLVRASARPAVAVRRMPGGPFFRFRGATQRAADAGNVTILAALAAMVGVTFVALLVSFVAHILAAMTVVAR